MQRVVLISRLAKQAGIAETDRYAQFKTKYRNDPAGFIRDCIRWGGGKPTPYQLEVAGKLPIVKRESVRGPHEIGKTAIAALVVLWFATTRDGEDWKIPMTASVGRQLTHFLLPEVHKWARRLKWKQIGRGEFDPRTELLDLNLKLKTGRAFALSSRDPDWIEGAHADHILWVLDEAKSIADPIWDAVEGSFMGGSKEALALAISTPGDSRGRFWEIQTKKPGYEDWWTRHITMQEAIAAGRMTVEAVEQRRCQWGEKSAVFQRRVLGEFAVEDEDSVIPLTWVEQAQERWTQWDEAGRPGALTCVSCDVGGGSVGGDQSVVALVYDGGTIGELRKYPVAVDPHLAMMELTGRIAGVLETQRPAYTIIDVAGIGAGVVHRLRELGWNVQGFNAAYRTGLTDVSGELGFLNWRSAMWWIGREMLQPENEYGVEVKLPPDDQLTGELCSVKLKRITSASQRQVEAKDEVRKRLGRSTDCADAVLQALAGPALFIEAEDRREIVYRPKVIAPF